jgi:hypothetical protein
MTAISRVRTGRQDIAKLASFPGDAVVARPRAESRALVVTFSRDGEKPEEMFASDGERAWRNAIALIAKREWLLSGDTLTVRRTEDDQIVEIVGRPHGEATASNPTMLNFQTLGGRNED